MQIGELSIKRVIQETGSLGMKKGWAFKCKQCGEWFKVEANFRKHLWNIHRRYNPVAIDEDPKRVSKGKKMQPTKLDPRYRVTVCNSCFRACCWQGEFMCDNARSAGTVVMTVAELRAGNYGEHEDYWKKGE